MSENGLGPLNLSDGDTSGFEALDAGRYPATVFEIKIDSVKNKDGQGKMPAGTPMIKVQYRLSGEGVENRRVFQQFVIPPVGYDPDAARKLKGMLINFFIATGDTEEQVRSSDFDPDYEDYIGREVVVVLSKKEYPPNSGEYQNNVTGVKPAGSEVGAASGLL